MKLRYWSFPTSIQIEAYQVTSEIAVYYSIHIYHRKNSKLVLAK